MNKLSSRSHCIFTMRVQAKRVIEDGNEFSVDTKLHLVDLAGSECAKTAAFDKNSGVSYCHLNGKIIIDTYLFTNNSIFTITFQA